ncbi:disease resistance protein RGA2-like [Eucalyptus grandis]|uniref:disease resistance protein RGA2-like n=1 Tax=Eucalyptus grandis TaxID=71139 RepID=UPI00192EC601|nr:disease resistance protein RGA2-like [Eucalyptus grandis]
MWVCVSNVFDEDFLIKELLKSARDEVDPKMINLQDIEKESKTQLQILLGKVLDGKKYLLVLDDLWNEDHGKWSELEGLLRGGLPGSKILVTMRNESAVKATAQGFIESLDENEELEEIEDDYVSDLLCGSFLEVEKVDPYTSKVAMQIFMKKKDSVSPLTLQLATIFRRHVARVEQMPPLPPRLARTTSSLPSAPLLHLLHHCRLKLRFSDPPLYSELPAFGCLLQSDDEILGISVIATSTRPLTPAFESSPALS